MNPITHALLGWACGHREANRTDRALVVIAGVAPDLDGLGILPEWLTAGARWMAPLTWYTDYHRLLCHNLLFCGGLAAGAWALTRKPRVAGLVFLSVHLHLLGDVLGARGPEGKVWGVPYLAPLSTEMFTWSGQWALNAWPNILLTVVLLGWTFWWAWRSGSSPVGLLSPRADAAFVDTLRQRFGPPAAPSSSD